MSKLNLRWNLFAKELIKHQFNATKSYMAAYPDSSYEAARASASELLTNPSFQKELDRELSKVNITEIVNERQVILNLLEDRELARQKNDVSAMARCDELLGKYLAMFTDRQAVKQDITIDAKHQQEIEEIKQRYRLTG
jgi:phage terminase small subunit